MANPPMESLQSIDALLNKNSYSGISELEWSKEIKEVQCMERFYRSQRSELVDIRSTLSKQKNPHSTAKCKMTKTFV